MICQTLINVYIYIYIFVCLCVYLYRVKILHIWSEISIITIRYNLDLLILLNRKLCPNAHGYSLCGFQACLPHSAVSCFLQFYNSRINKWVTWCDHLNSRRYGWYTLYSIKVSHDSVVLCFVTVMPWNMGHLPDTKKNAGCACAGNTGNVFPATDFKGNR